MATDLSAADKAAVVELLRETIAGDRFPHLPRVKRLRSIIAKLAPQTMPAPASPPPEPPPNEPSAVLNKKRRR